MFYLEIEGLQLTCPMYSEPRHCSSSWKDPQEIPSLKARKVIHTYFQSTILNVSVCVSDFRA